MRGAERLIFELSFLTDRIEQHDLVADVLPGNRYLRRDFHAFSDKIRTSEPFSRNDGNIYVTN